MTVPARPAVRNAVYSTVSYADLFDCPIHLERLHRSLIATPLSLLETSMAVDDLVTTGRLDRRDDVIFLAGREEILRRYDKSAKRASDMWPVAKTWAERIAHIPFVRMVAVTGGLAVDSLGPNDAVELFVVVRPRRLWTARLLISRVTRTAARQGVIVQVGYMATTRAQEVAQHDMSTAWELANMAVIIGAEVSRTLRRSNDWIYLWLPNATLDDNSDHLVDHTPSSKQKWTEWLLLLPPFRPFENWTRERQIAQLSANRDPDPHGSGAERFSIDLCDAQLGASAASSQQLWAERFNRS